MATDSLLSIFRSARRFFFGTLLSRIGGLGRDIALAVCFGSSPEIAAFMVAYRLANLFRRLFGEGNLQASFVPHFEALRAQEGRESAARFYHHTALSFGRLLWIVVLLLEGLFALLHWSLPAWREVIELSMWMVPGLFFVCSYALHASLLQCEQRYFLPAAAPVAFNAVWILAALAVYHLPKAQAVHWLALFVTVAFAAQWLLTAIAARAAAGPFLGPWRSALLSREWRALLKPLSLGVIGVGAMQLNSACDAIFARIADVRGPAFLWYALRVEQLPIALFGIALSGALLPPLSRAFQRGEGYIPLLQGALRQSALFIVPCFFALLALGRPGINLLYGHGDFTAADVEQTLTCLWGYALGLVPAVYTLLLANGLYAQKEYRAPALASLVSVAFHLALNAFLIFGLKLGALSVALSTSLSAFLNCALLAKGFSEKPLFDRAWRRGVLRLVLGCGLCAWLAQAVAGAEMPRAFFAQLGQFSLAAFCYGVGLLALARWMGLSEMAHLLRREVKDTSL